jgi:anti-sigma B factor antagonist
MEGFLSSPAGSLHLKIREADDGEVVVACNGWLVAGVTEVLHAEVKPLLVRDRRVVLDLTDLTKMDSMGLGTIVRLYASAKSVGCELELINLSARVRELFGITGLLSVLGSCGEHRTRMP